MRIEYLIQKSYATTHPYAGIASIEEHLRSNSFLVVMDKGSFSGILTPSDIIESPHQLVIDCLHDKPRLDFEQDVQSALDLMKESRNFVLPVLKEDEFVGVVTQSAITDYLLEYGSELEKAVSKRTAELKSANEQLQQEIGERKQAEQALRESEEIYRSLSNNIPGMVYRGRPDWSTEVISNSEDICGYAAEEFTSQKINWLDIVHPDDREKVLDEAVKLEKKPTNITQEYRIVDKSGGIRWVEDHKSSRFKKEGIFQGVDGIVVDITERKRAREQIRRLYSAIEQSIDGIAIGDLESRLTYVNDAFARMHGYTSEEMIGMEIVNLQNKEQMDEYKRAMHQIRTRGSWAGEIGHMKKDGTPFPTFMSITLLKADDGTPTAMLTVVKDITDLKKMEEEFVRAQKLESLGILAGGIAHDFNNLLTGILGNTALVKVRQKLKPEAFELVDEAEKAAFRAKHLTKQLLTFSKGGAPVKKTVSISNLLQDAATFALRGSNVRCEFSVPDDLWPVEVDEGQTGQAINNLVINADRAMPEGGILKVRAKNMIVGEGQGLPLKAGKYIQIAIEDHGVGIPEEHLQNIFDPYFSTKEKGRGLGLAVTYSIIKKHDGHIDVESQLGVGTTFYVYLPASKEPVVVESKDQELEKAHGGGRILVMDDEEIVRKLSKYTLQHIGYEVELARDGAEAIELYKRAIEAGRHFDAVILDLTIPGGMGGKEAITRLLEIDPEVKAVICSGYSNDSVLAEFRKYGFRGVVEKPYRIEDLRKTLHKVIIGEGN